MKKILILVVLVVLVLMVSCTAEIQLKSEGWEIFQCGWSLAPNEVLVQSHDGYICDDVFYNEHIFAFTEETPKFIIINKLNHEIDVKITYAEGQDYWTTIPAKSRLKLTEKEN